MARVVNRAVIWYGTSSPTQPSRFTSPDAISGRATESAIAAIEKYVFTSDPDAAAKIREGVGWYDEGAALDTADVRAQLAWFTAQNMVKGPIDAAAIIDTAFLPTR